LIAKHALVPVQTVLIESNSAYLGKGWPIFRKPAMPIYYHVRLGRRFDPPSLHPQHFMAELEQYFAQELTETSIGNASHPVNTHAD